MTESEMEAALRDSLHRVETNRDLRENVARPKQDEYDHRALRDEVKQGREVDHRFGPMLERLGFRWVPADRLPPTYQGGMRFRSRFEGGKWIHAGLGLAWTDYDLFAVHGNSPELFFDWFEDHVRAERAALAKRQLRKRGILVA